MSLFGSLYTAVSGLSAQSQATAIISNNIANVNTTGFKRSEAAFAALVTVESASAKYSPGAVKVHRLQQVDQQGQIAQTGSSLDVAIAGDGFFTVRAENSLDLEGDFKFTRNGQFFEDEEGVLQNSAGMYLYGWTVDEQFADPNMGPDQTIYNPDPSALVPVNVSLAAGQSRQTTEGNIGLNLDANEGSRLVNYATGLVDFPSQDLDYSRTLRVYDSLGASHDITFEFQKVYGPQAAFASAVAEIDSADLLSQPPYNLPTIGTGSPADSTFDVDIGGTVATITIDVTTTVSDVINQINAMVDGLGDPVADAYLSETGELVITALDPADTLALTDGTGIPLNTLGFDLTPSPITPNPTLPPDNVDILPPNDDSVFPQTAVDPYVDPTSPAYNPRGWWQVNVVGPNGAAPLGSGLLNFNSDGSLNARSDLNGAIDIELRSIDWGNGSEFQDIDININGLTQFAGLYNVSVANQNGAELGLKTGLEIDREGYVNARFSNGTLSRLYKLPIVTFPSATNLQEISATSYVESAESGSPLLQEAGVSQAGFLETTAIEQSNVDLADEFTRLIVTQRAYSANTRVVNTVDQMTEDLLRLR